MSEISYIAACVLTDGGHTGGGGAPCNPLLTQPARQHPQDQQYHSPYDLQMHADCECLPLPSIGDSPGRFQPPNFSLLSGR